MDLPCRGEACFHHCCLNPFLEVPESQPAALIPGSAEASRYDFVVATASSLNPNTHFTNHESLPSLEESFACFTGVYPQYSETQQADQIRDREYYHLSLSSHVCLDYIGRGLFSFSQVQSQNSIASSSSSPCIQSFQLLTTEPSLFDISYKSSPAKLNTQILQGNNIQDSNFESKIRKRIMEFMNVSEAEYTTVFTANQTSCFKLLAESYPFQSHHDLLTVYDHESEALQVMIDSSKKRGARVMSAEFSWPNMAIQPGKLKKKIVSKSKKHKRGLFVFPLQSRVTGSTYSYSWMSLARENGWHVLLDASALGEKEMDTLGLSLFKPDFLFCSFYKVFGENPSGFCCLFIKKSIASILTDSTGVSGIVNLIPAAKLYQFHHNSDVKTEQNLDRNGDGKQLQNTGVKSEIEETGNSTEQNLDRNGDDKQLQNTGVKSEIEETGDSTEQNLDRNGDDKQLQNTGGKSEIEETGDSIETYRSSIRDGISSIKISKLEFRGLDHADSLGLIHISSRTRCLINWLVNALTSLRHPNSESGDRSVKIYGPKIRFDRGPAVAFNVFDWKGEKIDPALVQKLADRYSISLSIGILKHVKIEDKHEEERETVPETEVAGSPSGGKLSVVTAALGFLTNFEDVYRVWAFVSRFLDADFVEKEKWRYKALNQKIIEI